MESNWGGSQNAEPVSFAIYNILEDFASLMKE